MMPEQDRSGLNLLTHEYVLGADIADNQRDPDLGTAVHAYGSDARRDQRCRRYLAAWARRTLFRVDEQRTDRRSA
jgi:hypothetical protein